MFYGVKITQNEEGKFVLSCRDMPEYTASFDSKEEAENFIGEFLPGCMMLFYRKKQKSIPLPSPVQNDEMPVYVPLKVQAKILFWNYIKSKELRMADVAKELGVTFTAVSRYCDLTTDSASVDAIEAALEKLGGHFDLTVR